MLMAWLFFSGVELTQTQLKSGIGKSKGKQWIQKKKKKDVKTQIHMMETNVIKNQVRSLKEKKWKS